MALDYSEALGLSLCTVRPWSHLLVQEKRRHESSAPCCKEGCFFSQALYLSRVD